MTDTGGCNGFLWAPCINSPHPRHGFCEALTKMNVNIVQAAMGHASVSTTGRYLAPEEEEMSDALARMSSFR